MGALRTPSPAAVDVLGLPVTPLPLSQLLDLAFESIAANRKTLFTTANAHSLVVAQHLSEFAAHFRDADAILADGVSAAFGARLAGALATTRTCGPDFFEAFLARAATEGVSVFLLGTTDATLARLATRCRERWPGIVIKGTLSPPYGALTDEQSRAMVDAINAAQPSALFVAMTAPKQELWLSRHLDQLNVRFAMGVGAAFDFLAGSKPRAPGALRRLGLEWLFRLVVEPRRMWRRNVDNLRFVKGVAGTLLRQALRKVNASPHAPRREMRQPIRLPASVAHRRAHTVNVSHCGVCLDLPVRLDAGDTVAGQLYLPGGEVSFCGLVTWTRGGSAMSRVGVRFTTLPDLLAPHQTTAGAATTAVHA